MDAKIARNTSKRKAGKNDCRNGAFIQKTLAFPALCIALVGIANVNHGAEHLNAEEKESASGEVGTFPSSLFNLSFPEGEFGR